MGTRDQIQDYVGIERLFKTYYQSLCFFSNQYVRNSHLAEDIVQSVFAKLAQNPPELDGESHARNLLFRMVRNASINELRRLDIHADALNQIPEPEEDQNSDFFVQAARAEVYRQILDAVDQLPSACAQVFRLAYLKQMDNDQVAKSLSISINTVKVQKNRAKKKLRILLKNLYPLCCVLFHF